VKCSNNRRKKYAKKKKKRPIQGCTPLLLSMVFFMKIFNNNFFMVYKHLKITFDDQIVLANVTTFSNFGGFPILISLLFFT
jgi:membrane protein insertase Oxa1/YidC/SpoIIIJ